jgi:hypothetical protein
MPRKKITTRRVRKLKPTEIDLILDGIGAHNANLESNWITSNEEWKRYNKVVGDLQGRWNNLAIIVEDVYDEWGFDKSVLEPKA